MFLAFRSLFRSYHIVKAVEFAPETNDRFFHSFLARASDEQLRNAKVFAHRIRTRGLLGGLFIPAAFISYILQKHKK